MAQRKTLSEGQVAVLRWIANGCPSGVMSGHSHRISVAALRRRGLVATSGHGATWAATIEQAGRDYLALTDGPNPPQPRQANVSVTEQLVADVISAGGLLRVLRKSWYDLGGIDFERRARLAQRHGKVPAGKQLTVTTASPDEVQIELIEGEPALGGV